VKAFEKLISQKKIILKLEVEHSQLKVIHLVSGSKYNPSYEELQQAPAMNTFEKLIFQKKIILKLEVEHSQLKNDFECLKDDHASIVNEKNVILCIEPRKESSPKYVLNWMDFTSCETCPSLHVEIKSLTHKLVV